MHCRVRAYHASMPRVSSQSEHRAACWLAVLGPGTGNMGGGRLFLDGGNTSGRFFRFHQSCDLSNTDRPTFPTVSATIPIGSSYGTPAILWPTLATKDAQVYIQKPFAQGLLY